MKDKEKNEDKEQRILYDTVELTPENCTISPATGDLADAVEGASLIVKVDAAHLDYVNRNYYKYITSSVRTAAKSWLKPFNLPVLPVEGNHYMGTEPVGRVIDYEIVDIEGVTDPDVPSSKLVLTLHITDPDAVQKVKDRRYLTVSVGSVPLKIVCSICHKDVPLRWPWDDECEHERGQEYDGEVCFWHVFIERYSEVSFVNNPADSSPNHASQVVSHSPGDRDNSTVTMDAEKLSAFYWESYDGIMDEIEKAEEISDVRLTTKKRAKLSTKKFAGPKKSFPLIDEAHVLAAFNILQKYEGSGDKTELKTKILDTAKIFKMGEMKINKDSEKEALLIDNLQGDAMEQKKLEDLQTQISDSEVKITGLTTEISQKDADIKQKDEEIVALQKKVDAFEAVEKQETVDSLFELKVKYNSEDLKDYFEEEDEAKKTKLANTFKDSLKEKSSDELRFAVDTLTSVQEKEIVEDDEVNLDDAAKDKDGNVIPADKKLDDGEDKDKDKDIDPIDAQLNSKIL